MKHSCRLRALLASALVIGVMAVAPTPATAQTSDVSLAIDPTADLLGDFIAPSGTVSCSSTTVDGDELLSARVRQSGREVDSSLGFAVCDPSTGEGFWIVFFEPGQHHPGNASVTVQLTLDDGTNVSATGSVRITAKPARFAGRVDDTYFDPIASTECGFPVQGHDVGRRQFFGRRDVVVEGFTGTTTFTNLDTGISVAVESSFRVTFSTDKVVFTGLNYRILTSSGQLVSAGRGVMTVDGETGTPHLVHLFPVLCELLAES